MSKLCAVRSQDTNKKEVFMPRAKLTLTNWDKVEDEFNYPCAKGREWITKQLKKGMTPLEIWKSCNNPEHILYIFQVISLKDSSAFIDWEEREKFDISPWCVYADEPGLTRREKQKICNALRSRASWTKVKDGLIKAGWR